MYDRKCLLYKNRLCYKYTICIIRNTLDLVQNTELSFILIIKRERERGGGCSYKISGSNIWPWAWPFKIWIVKILNKHNCKKMMT